MVPSSLSLCFRCWMHSGVSTLCILCSAVCMQCAIPMQTQVLQSVECASISPQLHSTLECTIASEVDPQFHMKEPQFTIPQSLEAMCIKQCCVSSSKLCVVRCIKHFVIHTVYQAICIKEQAVCSGMYIVL